MRHSQEL